MPIFGLLRAIPAIGRGVTAIITWLAQRKWGQWLMFYLAAGIGAWIQKIVTFAGVMFVSSEYAMPALLPYISGPLLGLPEAWQGFLGLTKVDQAISIILSAVVVRAASSIKIARNPNSPNWTTSPGAS